MKKILIVDDQLEIRELLSVTLQFGPYTIFQAANGREAIELARRESPHLILLDVQMETQGIDGFEVCRKLRASEKTRGIFVMMLTSCDQEREIEEGYAAGANEYLVKPFSPLQLMTKVHQIVH